MARTVIILQLCLVASASLGPVLTPFDHFTKPVRGNGILTGGRPQPRELLYLAQAGIQSFISVFPFSATDTWKGVTGDWLSSQEQVSMARSLGLNATFFNSSFTRASVIAVSDAIIAMPKPVYVHCHVGWSADLFTQLHLVRVGAASATAIYNDTIALGWDFQSDTDANALVQSFGGGMAPVRAPSLELDLAAGEGSYQYYYWAHRLGLLDGYYNVGQVLSTHVGAIKTAGYRTVISFRGDGEATTRLPGEGSAGFVPNNEFSDLEGHYDAKAEKDAFKSVGLVWVNLPVVGADSFTLKQFQEFEPQMARAALAGPVLSHCTSGYRSAVYSLAFLGKTHGHCTEWALARAAEAGYQFDVRPGDARVISFWKAVLGC